jgi:SAM-dependent methyltransferase
MITRATRGGAFSNDSGYAQVHHEALAALVDPFTQWRIDGLLDLTGKRCLEITTGSGSLASWLADQVGEHGYVLATGLSPGYIPQVPRLSVVEHDITTGSPPGTDYDLAHVRMLLNHLPQRRHILYRLVTTLKTDGVLLTQDWLPAPPEELVLAAPGDEEAELMARFHRTYQAVLAKHGSDRTWAQRAHLAMLEEGLADVETVTYGSTWPGGGPGCKLMAAGLAQLRPQLIAAGMTPIDLDHVGDLLDDPGLVLRGPLLYSTSGRR